LACNINEGIPLDWQRSRSRPVARFHHVTSNTQWCFLLSSVTSQLRLVCLEITGYSC